MPKLSNVDSYRLSKDNVYFTVNSKEASENRVRSSDYKFKSGFSLIEILLSLLFIGAIVTILFTTTGSLFTRRASNIQSIATKEATRQIEIMRGQDHDVMITTIDTLGLNCSVDSFINNTVVITASPETSNVELTRLTTISCYDTADSADIVNVNVTISWTNDNGGSRNIVMDTMIANNGL